jgi:hypothetical protein
MSKSDNSLVALYNRNASEKHYAKLGLEPPDEYIGWSISSSSGKSKGKIKELLFTTRDCK